MVGWRGNETRGPEAQRWAVVLGITYTPHKPIEKHTPLPSLLPDRGYHAVR